MPGAVLLLLFGRGLLGVPAGTLPEREQLPGVSPVLRELRPGLSAVLSKVSVIQSGYALMGGSCVACGAAFAATCDSAGLVLSCLSGYWQNGNSCSPCREFCLVCSSPASCLTCQPGYFVAVGSGSYCQPCSSGCLSCSASACTLCAYNYQLATGACSDISGNCSLIAHCQSCVTSAGAAVCHSCAYPYFATALGCQLGASLLCQSGATGPMYYQCLDSCAPFGYLLEAQGSSYVCLPLSWVGSVQQVYLNAFAPRFAGSLYATALELVYFDAGANSGQVGTSVLSFDLTLSPYYKAVIYLKLVSTAPAGSSLFLTATLTDNSSRTEAFSSSHSIATSPQPLYLTLQTRNIKEQLVTLSLVSAVSGMGAELVLGLAECLLQVHGCPANCRLCYNAELCIECEGGFFNTPQLLCVAQCLGYLELYLPAGDPLNFTAKQCVLSCPAGYYALQLSTAYRCLPCVGLCLTCLSATQCLSCQPGFLLYDISFECLAACPPTHYGLNAQCALCPAPCATCRDASTCLSCSAGYFSNGSCTTACPQGNYPNSTSAACEACEPSCSSCEGSPTSCLGCIAPFLLFESSCVASCPSGLYFESNGSCQGCSSPCLQCAGSGSCLSCQVGYLLGSGCLTECPSGHFGDGLSSSCLPCLNSCITCSSDTLCLSCAPSRSLYSYQCLAACPLGTYAQGGLCLDCIAPCSACSAPASCLACGIGYLSILVPGSCLVVC
jgi:hypothetical protein